MTQCSISPFVPKFLTTIHGHIIYLAHLVEHCEYFLCFVYNKGKACPILDLRASLIFKVTVFHKINRLSPVLYLTKKCKFHKIGSQERIFSHNGYDETIPHFKLTEINSSHFKNEFDVAAYFMLKKDTSTPNRNFVCFVGYLKTIT